MSSYAERNYLHRDVRQFRRGQDIFQLGAHDSWTTDHPMEGCLVEDDPELQWRGNSPGQELLAPQPGLDSLFYELRSQFSLRWLRQWVIVQGPYIIRRLQQTGHDRRVVVFDADRFGL